MRGRAVYWTPERVVASIQAIATQIGRAPSSRELMANGGPDRSVCCKYFGSYRGALTAVGLKAHPSGGRRLHWTPERSLDALKQLTVDLGRVPRSRELGTMRCPSTKYFQKYFGSLSEAYRLAGIEVPRPGRKPDLPISPRKAAAITQSKQAFWSERARGRHGLTGWTHPYARRSA